MEQIRFNFLYIDTYSFGRTWFFPDSVIPYSMLRYIENGAGVFFIDGEEISVRKNQIIYIPQGCRMACHSLSDRLSFTSIRFISSVFLEGGDILSDYYGLPRLSEARGEEGYFRQIYSWVKSESPARMYFVRGYLELLLGSLIERGKTAAEGQRPAPGREKSDTEEMLRQRIRKTTARMDARIQLVVDYITLHPTESYTPARMAEMADLSRQRFSSLFKEQTGKSPMNYIKELRLTTAARRLLVSSDPVSDIAYSVGYEDPNYFIREFKSAFGYTPNQYRKAARE